MKTTYFQAFLLLYFSFLLSSCTHYYYAPDEGHLMSLNEKGDVKISGGVSETNDDEDNNFNLQAGYSPINHLGLQASHFSLKRTGGKSNVIVPRGNGYITSGAIGTYYFFENNKIRKVARRKDKKQLIPDYLKMKKGVLLDLYAGYGKGEVFNTYSNGAYTQFNFQKSYIQGGIHWQGKLIGISYVFKAVKLDYQNGIVLKELEPDDLEAIQSLSAHNPFSFVEHSFRIHFGLRQGRFYLSSTGISKKPDEIGLSFIDSSHHIGLIIEIDEFFKKRE